jgi:hypothetical protein
MDRTRHDLDIITLLEKDSIYVKICLGIVCSLLSHVATRDEFVQEIDRSHRRF